VVTTASGRGVWRRAFPAWSHFSREVRVLGVDAETPCQTEVAITSWDSLSNLASRIRARPDLLILDEDQRATNPAAARSQHAYGRPLQGGLHMLTVGAVVQSGDRVWHLSGLPAPHDLGQFWPRLRASFPERLGTDHGPTDVTTYDDFRRRYCVVKTKRLSNFTTIPVVFGGRNVGELRSRLAGTFIRHTQEEVGIQEPRYELMPLVVSAARRRECNGARDQRRVLAAAESGTTRDMEMELGSLRRVTGLIKAGAVVDAVKEEFANGIEKLVLAYWHKDVGDKLDGGLRSLGVLRLDGATSARDRESLESKWRQKKYGIFLAQVRAAGEAIDLSAASEMWVVEPSLGPGDMDQISKRIINVGQKRRALIRVVTLEGTIDEIIQEILLRLWAPLKEVLR
jgi:SWI/SNF-related matrix-associated actin-dependent regulator of chromatin subfamily A-like protein 1